MKILQFERYFFQNIIFLASGDTNEGKSSTKKFVFVSLFFSYFFLSLLVDVNSYPVPRKKVGRRKIVKVVSGHFQINGMIYLKNIKKKSVVYYVNISRNQPLVINSFLFQKFLLRFNVVVHVVMKN